MNVDVTIEAIDYKITINGDSVLVESIDSSGQLYAVLQGKWRDGRISSAGGMRIDLLDQIERAVSTELDTLRSEDVITSDLGYAPIESE